MNHIHTVQAIYQAFGRGDIPNVLEHCTENIAWDADLQDRGIPWLKPATGKSGVARFFQTLNEHLEFTHFAPTAFFDNETQVVVLVEMQARVRTNGRLLHDREVHVWSFDADGKVSSMRHFLDTHGHFLAAS